MFPQNPAHLHLMLNHVPIIGFAFGVLLFIVSHLWKSKDVERAAQLVLFVSALLTIPVYLSGEPAEETIFGMQGISHAAIETHEDAALWAMIAVQLTGLVALAGLVISRGNRVALRPLSILNFILCLMALVIIARTNNLGGKIHHPETRPGFVAPSETEGEQEGDDN